MIEKTHRGKVERPVHLILKLGSKQQQNNVIFKMCGYKNSRFQDAAR